MKFFFELLNADRTQPNTDATYRTYGTASNDYIPPRFSSLLAHNIKTKLEFYRHQSLHTTARNEAAIIPLLVQTITGTYSTSVNFPPASDVSLLIVYLLYPVPTPRLF